MNSPCITTLKDLFGRQVRCCVITDSFCSCGTGLLAGLRCTAVRRGVAAPVSTEPAVAEPAATGRLASQENWSAGLSLEVGTSCKLYRKLAGGEEEGVKGEASDETESMADRDGQVSVLVLYILLVNFVVVL